MKRRSLATVALAFLIFHFSFASAASADIVVFKNGRTMSVKSCIVDAEHAKIVMREGGEATFPASIIARVDPDEVPYPDDSALVVDTAVSPLPAPALIQQPQMSDETLAARPFATLISNVAATHNVDVRLVHAVIEQESNYQPRARSKKGARGLMQLTPY